MSAHSGIIHNSQKVETTQMYINWWTDKQNVVYPYNGYKVVVYTYTMYNSHKKEWSADACYNIDEPWKHYAK